MQTATSHNNPTTTVNVASVTESQELKMKPNYKLTTLNPLDHRTRKIIHHLELTGFGPTFFRPSAGA